MNTYLKLKPASFQLLIFGSMTAGFFLILLFLGAAVITQIYDVNPEALMASDLSDPNVLSAIKTIQALSSIVVFLIPGLLFAYLSDKKPLQYIGFKNPMPPVFWFIAVILIFISLPVVGWLGNLNQNIHLPAAMQATEKSIRAAEESATKMLTKFLEMKSTADLFQMLFIVAVLPAIAEELFFRGVIQRLLIQITKRPLAGIILTGIIFSAFHWQFLGFIPRAVLGILLGLLFWYSGSLWPGILAHFVFNGAQVVLVYLNPKYATMEPQYNIGLIVGSTFFTLLLLYWMKHISHTHYAVVYDTDDEFTIERGPDQPE